MNLVDVAIASIVVLGVVLGWSRGLIGPLIAEATFLAGYWVISSHPALVSSQLPQGASRPFAMLGLLAAISVAVGSAGRLLLGATFRLPLARQADKFLGAAVHGLLAIVVVYVLLLGTSGVEKVLGPISGVASIRSAQIDAMRTLLTSYPQAASIVDSSQLVRLERAASTHPVPVGQLGEYAGTISWYERALRPQLATSRLAPLVARIGAHLPVFGQRVTLPSS